MEELDWCLDQLETIQTYRSVSDMASNKVQTPGFFSFSAGFNLDFFSIVLGFFPDFPFPPGNVVNSFILFFVAFLFESMA